MNGKTSMQSIYMFLYAFEYAKLNHFFLFTFTGTQTCMFVNLNKINECEQKTKSAHRTNEISSSGTPAHSVVDKESENEKKNETTINQNAYAIRQFNDSHTLKNERPCNHSNSLQYFFSFIFYLSHCKVEPISCLATNTFVSRLLAAAAA